MWENGEALCKIVTRGGKVVKSSEKLSKYVEANGKEKKISSKELVTFYLKEAESNKELNAYISLNLL